MAEAKVIKGKITEELEDGVEIVVSSSCDSNIVTLSFCELPSLKLRRTFYMMHHCNA